MTSLFRTGLIAAAAATALSGCVIVIGNEDDYDDDLVYSDSYQDNVSRSATAYPSGTVLGDVRTRFNDDQFLRDEPILISASDGVVTLSGEVDNARTIERAVDVARQTPGVDSVVLKVVLLVD